MSYGNWSGNSGGKKRDRAGLWGCMVMVGSVLLVIAVLAALAWGVTQGMHAR